MRASSLSLLSFAALSWAGFTACAPFSAIEGPSLQEGSGQAIVAGGLAEDRQFPHQVAVRVSEELCGGTIVGDHWVLTSATCVDGAAEVSIEGGALDLGQGTTREVDEIRVNPGSNLALLHVDAGLPEGTRPVQVIGELESELVHEGGRATLVGWGAAGPWDDAHSESLMFSHLPILNPDQCGTPVEPDLGCAGYFGGGAGACDGDQGAPVLIENGGHWVLIGAADADPSCGDGPVRFTRIAPYADWLRATVPTLQETRLYPDDALVVDDHGNTSLAATNVEVEPGAQELHGTLDADDVDVFRLAIDAPGSIAIETDTEMDLFWGLLELDGHPIVGAMTDDALPPTPVEAATYFLVVWGIDETQVGDYHLTLTHVGD